MVKKKIGSIFKIHVLLVLFQECKFNVGSYIHDATQIYFTGTYGHDVANQRAQQYEIKITDLASEDTTVIWANRNYSQTGFKVSHGLMIKFLVCTKFLFSCRMAEERESLRN